MCACVRACVYLLLFFFFFHTRNPTGIYLKSLFRIKHIYGHQAPLSFADHPPANKMAGNQALGEVDLLRDASHCSVDYDDTIPLDISVAAIPNVPGAFLLHNILSPAECEQHMRVADGLSWEPSPLRSFQTLNSTRFNTNQVCFLTPLPTNDHNIVHPVPGICKCLDLIAGHFFSFDGACDLVT